MKSLSPPHTLLVSRYAELMVPCWDPITSARPSFADLGDTSRALGGVLSDRMRVGDDNSNDDKGAAVDHTTSASPIAGVHHIDNLADTELYDPDFWESPDGLQLRGVSVHHLHTQLLPMAIEMTRVPFDCGGPTMVPPPPADEVTIKHTVVAVVIPRCRDLVCPRDGLSGCAYVDSLSKSLDVGPSSALLSCVAPHQTTLALRHRI